MSERKPGWMSDLEWADQRNRGMIWCHRDQDWEPADQFQELPRRPGVRASSCRRSLAARPGRKDR